jgi:hypothetical protein
LTRLRWCGSCWSGCCAAWPPHWWRRVELGGARGVDAAVASCSGSKLPACCPLCGRAIALGGCWVVERRGDCDWGEVWFHGVISSLCLCPCSCLFLFLCLSPCRLCRLVAHGKSCLGRRRGSTRSGDAVGSLRVARKSCDVHSFLRASGAFAFCASTSCWLFRRPRPQTGSRRRPKNLARNIAITFVRHLPLPLIVDLVQPVRNHLVICAG